MTVQELKSRLTLPLIAAPMFLVSGVDMVVASCINGIVGSFPSLNGRTKEDFEKMLIDIQTALSQYEQQTGKKPAPFAVNLIVNKTNPRLMDDLKLCIQYQVPIVITSLGAVKEIVDAVHSYGGLIFHDVIKKRHAQKAAEAGVDGIICVASGAGGHAGTAHPFALIQEIRKVYDGALILSGAINSGQEVVAAQAIGCEFAYMGTRLIATHESMASDEYKQMLLQSEIEDCIYTKAVSGVHANFLKQSIVKAGIDLTQVKEEDFAQLSNDEAKAWKNIWSAGHGVTAINNIPSISDLINQLTEEYHATILKLKEYS